MIDIWKSQAGVASMRVRMCLLSVAAMLMAGCASLPDMAQLAQGESAGKPAIVSGGAVLSSEKTEEILRRLQRENRTGLLERHFAFMEAVDPVPIVAGNAARLLVDGTPTYEAMFDAIAAATDHVNLETYIFDEEGIGEPLSALLIKKRAQGVAVNLMYDSVGSIDTKMEFFQRLRDNGINICEFNPVNPLRGRLFSLNHRDHRKILVVDGHTGFTGGINISGVYSSSSAVRRERSKSTHPWRDTHIEIRGPAVAELQKLFIDSWQRQRCRRLADKAYFPPVEPQGNTLVRTLGSTPADKVNLIYVELLSAIQHAERSIHMTVAYFVPDAQTILALKEAAARGVEVALILPSFSDYKITFHAGRSFYSELLQAGVRIYERKGALLHAKTAVVDGIWSTVGSTNIDLRSFLYNDEINVIVLGSEFGEQMEAQFREDLAAARKIELASWEQRSYVSRLKEDLARMWAPWL